jgi:hypothetical protein
MAQLRYMLFQILWGFHKLNAVCVALGDEILIGFTDLSYCVWGSGRGDEPACFMEYAVPERITPCF